MNIKHKIKLFIGKHRYQKLKIIEKYFFGIAAAFRVFCKDVILEYRKICFLNRRIPIIDIYLKSHKIRKLQIGSGKNPLSGWLNTDFYPKSKKEYILTRENLFLLKIIPLIIYFVSI